MALYLLHTLGRGEPQGIWAEDGNHVYLPGINPSIEKRGAASISVRNTLPWVEFVDRKASQTPRADAWVDVNDPGTDLRAILDAQVQEYNTRRAAGSPTDK